ncbi:MAG: hypothetical protein Q9200_006773, partial [Gallowayella weberi]
GKKMQLRNRKQLASPPPVQKKQGKGAKKDPTPRNGRQSTGVQKTKSATDAQAKGTGKKGQGRKKPPPTRRENAKTKAKRLEREQQELEQQREGLRQERERLEQERERFDQQRRDAQLRSDNGEPAHAAAATTTTQAARAAAAPATTPETAAEPQRSQRLQVSPPKDTIKFRMKPYYKPIGPLDPRPAGVQKVKEWRGHVLLPLGKPYWRRNREGELELRLPMLADTAELEEREFRKKGKGMMGKIMDYLNREKEANKDEQKEKSPSLPPSSPDEEEDMIEEQFEEGAEPNG